MSRLPRVFHQVWIERGQHGAPRLPALYQAWRDSWLAQHPQWQYKLWNLHNLDFTPTHAALIDAAPSPAQKADILRYEILWHHGGVYLDVDFECLRPIDGLLDGVDNFAVSENGRVVSIGIIGAAPGSTYMRRCIERMPARVGLAPPNVETGPGFFTQCLLGGGLGSDLVMFPSAWFYPYAMHERERAGGPFPEAYAVHHWAASWATPRRSLLRRGFERMRRLVAAAAAPTA